MAANKYFAGSDDERGLSALTMILAVGLMVGVGVIAAREVDHLTSQQSALVVAQYDLLLAEAVAKGGTTTISSLAGVSLPMEATAGENGTALNQDVYGGVPSLFFQNGEGYALQAATVPFNQQPVLTRMKNVGMAQGTSISGDNPEQGAWSVALPTGAPTAGNAEIVYGSVVATTASTSS